MISVLLRAGSCWAIVSRCLLQRERVLISSPVDPDWNVSWKKVWPPSVLTSRTTFVSAVFATLNSLSLQEYVARWISDYLTSETGVTVM